MVKAALSFFACVRTDDAAKGPYAQYAVRNHTGGYWMLDMSQECYSGWHKAWAFGLGLPAVLVLCVGVPVGMLWFLWSQRARTADPDFRECFGFLYRNYRDSRVWWEAIWAFQTVLLTVVAVFHYSIKAFYSMIILGIMLQGSAVLQAIAKPYAQPQLHRLPTCCNHLPVPDSVLHFGPVYGVRV